MPSRNWPRYPAIYEINTWTWLADLSRRYGTFAELGEVPDAEWDAIAALGVDAVWLLGVWERNPACIALANRDPSLLDAFRQALPDFHPLDNIGSPSCVRSYVAEQLLGGPGGLADARRELARRGVRLILDLAPDHAWVTETVLEIATQCDGLMCQPAGTEPWEETIAALRLAQPGFLLIAQACGDREWELQRQGFDFCYDKRLYDRLAHGTAGEVRSHLTAGIEYQSKLVRFIENHDEPRAAAIFSPEQERAAAIVMATLPGARLFHEGQLDGAKTRLPVFLGRRPAESPDCELREFYKRLLDTIADPLFHEGTWSLCERSGWPDNPTFHNLVAWNWAHGEDRCLVVVNLSDRPAQARVELPWVDVQGDTWRLSDLISGAIYDRAADEIRQSGLYVDLAAWGCHLLQCRRAERTAVAIAA